MVKETKMTEFSLFNAADEAIVEDMSFASFEESLLANILFQDRILLHESYFFGSSHLIRHIANSPGQYSLFELGAREGIITPAFRDPSTTTLEESFEIQNRPENYGGGYVGFPNKIDRRLRRMMTAFGEGFSVAPPVYWPGDNLGQTGMSVGQGYERIVKKYLSRDTPPIRGDASAARRQLFERVWEQSKHWRFDCVEEACKRTAAKGASGLQRGELFACVGWSLGIPRNQPATRLSQWKECCGDDPEKALALEVFYHWCNQCHHINLSEMFEAGVNLPAYNLDSDFVGDHLFSAMNEPTAETFEAFNCTVKLPEFKVLSSIPPTEIVSIRKELGAHYRNALRNYQLKPTTENRERIADAVSEYSESLCSRVPRHFVHDSRIEFLSPSSGSELLASIAVVAGSILAAYYEVGVYVGIAGAITAVIPVSRRFIRGKQAARSLKPKEKRIELNLPKQLEITDD